MIFHFLAGNLLHEVVSQTKNFNFSNAYSWLRGDEIQEQDTIDQDEAQEVAVIQLFYHSIVFLYQNPFA